MLPIQCPSSAIRGPLRGFRLLSALALLLALVSVPDRALAQSVVISELFYHPVDLGDPGEEFVELHNPTGALVDLDGWCFSDGISFCFGPGAAIPAGGYVVLALDAAQFQAAYGAVPDFSGYTGRLSNGGETLVLEDASASMVDRLSYDDVDPWPTIADGLFSSTPPQNA